MEIGCPGIQADEEEAVKDPDADGREALADAFAAAVETEGEAVIRALDPPRTAMLARDQEGAAVGTDVVEGAESVVLAPDDEDAFLRDRHTDEGTGRVELVGAAGAEPAP